MVEFDAVACPPLLIAGESPADGTTLGLQFAADAQSPVPELFQSCAATVAVRTTLKTKAMIPTCDLLTNRVG
jgi:hypothetical protein